MANDGERLSASDRSAEDVESAGLDSLSHSARIEAVETVGRLWGELARDGEPGCYGTTWAGTAARWQLRTATGDLLTLRRTARSSGRALCLALVPLVSCARLWRTFGPAAGNRRSHLLRRLEAELVYTQREIHAGELPVLVKRAMVTRAGGVFETAIDDLQQESVDRADALRALDDAAVQLASLACRIATTIENADKIELLAANERPALAHQLHVLGEEVATAAQMCTPSTVGDVAERRIGIWVGDALRIVSSAEALEPIGHHPTDGSLRAEALCMLRARWLDLGARLWLVARDLDALLAIETFENEARLPPSVSSRAATMIVASGLCERPGEFDHIHALARHSEALIELVRHVCQSLGTRDAEAVLCAQQLAVRRLVRVLGALWSIDEHTRRPAEQTSRRCS